MQVKKVLGTRLDLVSREEALDLIAKWLSAKAPRLKMVATAYSEFFVKAIGDVDFRMALESSDLVVPDGIGPLAAINFTESLVPSDNVFQKVIKGVKTGGAILAGKVGQPVAGSLPRLPQRLMVRVETRKSLATSETVSRSGRLARLSSFLVTSVVLSMSDIQITR